MEVPKFISKPLTGRIGTGCAARKVESNPALSTGQKIVLSKESHGSYCWTIRFLDGYDLRRRIVSPGNRLHPRKAVWICSKRSATKDKDGLERTVLPAVSLFHEEIAFRAKDVLPIVSAWAYYPFRFGRKHCLQTVLDQRSNMVSVPRTARFFTS
jgi:hypothetical protein